MRDFLIRGARETDLAAIENLLAANKLPLEGVREALANFIVAEGNTSVVGAAGAEVYGRYALLRSAVVDGKWQGFGIGRALVGEILSRARAKDIRTVYLLTTTAENYFPSFGFKRISRADIPSELDESPELKGACPASAVVMSLDL